MFHNNYWLFFTEFEVDCLYTNAYKAPLYILYLHSLRSK
jgi:hypothetical protein